MYILMFTQWFYPEPGPRVHELATELVYRGHRVTVVTGFPTVPYNHFYAGYRLKPFSWDSYHGVKVLRLAHFPHSRKSAYKRTLHYASFMLSCVFIGNMLIERADCMYVFLPPPIMGLAAAFIGLTHDIPFIYDIQDIWPESGVASGMVDNKWLVAALKILGKLIYPLATAICVPSVGYKRTLIGKGVPSEKIEIIPNWADESLYKPMPYNEGLAVKHKIKGKFNVTFAGNLGYAQSLDTIIEAAQKLSSQKDIQFVFAGDGIAVDALKNNSRNLGLTNVLFLGRLPMEEMPRLFSISDLLLVHLKKNPIFKITIPSKTQAYMACGKPILMAVDGDGAELIELTGSGVTCPQEDSTSLTDAILKVYRMSPENRKAMGYNARQAFLQQFSKKVVIGKFEKLLEKTAAMHNKGQK